jgi:hypothetical protein
MGASQGANSHPQRLTIDIFQKTSAHNTHQDINRKASTVRLRFNEKYGKRDVATRQCAPTPLKAIQKSPSSSLLHVPPQKQPEVALWPKVVFF